MLRKIFNRKKKAYIFPAYTYLKTKTMNKNYRIYRKNIFLHSLFNIFKKNKTLKILASDKIKVEFKPCDFKKMDISKEQLEYITKMLIEDISADYYDWNKIK